MTRGNCLLVLFLYFQVICSLSSFTPLNSTLFSCPPNQSVALLQFKSLFVINSSASFQGCDEYGVTSSPKTTTWKEGMDCCMWKGVTCDRLKGNVIGIDLSCSWLYGKIPSNNTLVNLPHLQRLNLAHNDFNGSQIPPHFGRLVSLTHLNLSYSWFSGGVPFEISHLSKLVSLDLSYNYYFSTKFEYSALDKNTLEMLTTNLTHLQHLFLDDVNMSSVTPNSFLNLSSSLVSLHLSYCELQGEFPVGVFHLPYLKELIASYNPNLKVTLPKANWSGPLNTLDLSFTNFSGGLPHSIRNLNSLRILYLVACGFTGAIPTLIWNLTQITHLDLARNSFNDLLPLSILPLSQLMELELGENEFVGPLPSNVCSFSKLTYLALEFNRFNGTIPSCLVGQSSLKTIILSGNQFTGQIPEFQSKSLMHIILYDNMLNGPIPVSVFDLVNLTLLDLSSNKINGSLPPWLFSMSSLELLVLSDNQFIGEIPEFHSKSFESIDLGQNMLTGQIPNSLFDLVNLTTLSLSSNKINGTLPLGLFSMPSLKTLFLFNNQFIGEIPVFHSKSFEWIDLGQNMLTGQIPNSLFDLENLTNLDLSSNNLHGILELDKLSKLKNLQDLYLSQTNITIPTSHTVNSTFPKLSYLDLSFCNMSEFPNFLKLQQDELRHLGLSNNKIHGCIPKWMSNVGEKSMYFLNLSHNRLTTVNQLPWNNLQYLDLRSNWLEGPLPILPVGVIFFAISNNSLSGVISSSICNVSSLEVLDLSHNNLTGMIPLCLGDLSRNLLVLDLRMNRFQGTIPTTFPKECNLQNLNLHGNQLEGLIPQSLGNCNNLEVLDLGNNMFTGNFPAWFGTFKNLRVLVLRYNKLHGWVPAELSGNNSFQSLQVFDLSNNLFNGPLPARYMQNFKSMMSINESGSDPMYLGQTNNPYKYDYAMTLTFKGFETEMQKIFHVFTSIDLSNNKFEGEIPKDIGKFHSLHAFNVSHNQLRGRLPTSLGDLSNLEWLDLSANMLVGEIPTELADLTYLAILNLSHNQLEGRIPQGKQFNTFTIESYQGNSRLCGVPLSIKCESEDPQTPLLSTIQEENDKSSSFFCNGFSWQAVLTGSVCGVVFGVAMAFIMFQTRQPKWLLGIIEGKKNV